jgi:hypothetical protein
VLARREWQLTAPESESLCDRSWPVWDRRRINKRSNTSWSPNSVLSVGVSTKRFNQQVRRNCKRRGDQFFKVTNCRIVATDLPAAAGGRLVRNLPDALDPQQIVEVDPATGVL